MTENPASPSVPPTAALPDDITAANPKGLAGSNWKVETLNGKRFPSRGEVTIVFGNDGSVNGQSPCNSYGSQAAISTNEIAFSPVRSTRMACEPDVMAAEAAFFELIGGIVQWSMDDNDRLTLRGRSTFLTASRQR